MRIIKADARHPHGYGPFKINILYPGEALGLDDTGFSTIGRIDRAQLKPGMLVRMHPHQNDEILSYMRSGTMIHKDNVGHEIAISSAYMMLMNAGSGIQHEERIKDNGADAEMLQIFIRPYKNNLEPQVQFHQFANSVSYNSWRLVAGSDATAPLVIRSGTNVYDTHLNEGNVLQLPNIKSLNLSNLLYCFNGKVSIGNNILSKGDSLVFDDEVITIEAKKDSDLILFSMDKNSEYSNTGMFSGNQFRR